MPTSILLILLLGMGRWPPPSQFKENNTNSRRQTKRDRGMATSILTILPEGDWEMNTSILPIILKGKGTWPPPAQLQGTQEEKRKREGWLPLCLLLFLKGMGRWPPPFFFLFFRGLGDGRPLPGRKKRERDGHLRSYNNYLRNGEVATPLPNSRKKARERERDTHT